MSVADGVGDQLADDELRGEGDFLKVPVGQAREGQLTRMSDNRGVGGRLPGIDLVGAQRLRPGR
ncbi:hypothetical protein ADK35_24295 [Streptomyces viridochromogenes]|nr:hypothetical protein ADK36_26815 [Streptomyces viridochromogenes]KOG17331.1 hypothetical protein ADK35_24295 [Streptomyces viridochromogenes]